MTPAFRTALVLAGLVALLAVPPAHAGGDWNDGAIAWQPYAAGLAQAKKSGKPICLIFSTEWCPHCTNYAKLFHDPEVVKKSKQFVMIRLDKEKDAPLSKQYAPDGEYIPRTYFLSPAGVLEASLCAPREQFKYFYDEKSPAGILAGMNAALAKLR